VKIYTKTGDGGETGLLGGDRVAKNSPRITVIGTLDEVNAFVGIARQLNFPDLIGNRLERLQSQLFDIGSELACSPGGKFDLRSVGAKSIEDLELEIDKITLELPPLKNFILPGGTPQSANLHYLRALSRRLERDLLNLNSSEPVRTELLQFVNRLSDWLFCGARYANFTHGVEDVAWVKGTES
jgi:cob(I)alamin adenosyltransferase